MKKAKLFKNGRSQAVRLPKEFTFRGEEVNIRRVGESVVLTPVDMALGEALYAAIGMFSADFMVDGRCQPERQEREHPFE